MTIVRRREPMFSVPVVVAALIALMVAIQFLQTMVNPERALDWIAELGFVPARMTAIFDAPGIAAATLRLSDDNRAAAHYFIRARSFEYVTPLTYAFVHAGWLHLLSNSIWLLAFGAPVARRLHPTKFLLLFCVAAIGGALAQWLVHPFAFEPIVGASAGISGIMGAAARFVFQSGGPISPDPFEEPREDRPALSILDCVRDSRTMTFIVIWFLVNLIVGVGALPLGLSAEPIAWQAHIGGFAVGLLMFSWFDPTRSPPEENLIGNPDLDAWSRDVENR